MSTPTPQPPGWRTVKLRDLLDEEQCKRTHLLLMAHDGGFFEAVPSLRAYYRTFCEELRQKGVDYAYLAYAVAYTASRLGHPPVL